MNFKIAAITLLAASSLAGVAQATPSIEVSTNNGSTYTQETNSSSFTAGTFSVSVASVGSNSPGTPTGANLLSSSLNIVNTGGSSATLILVMSDIGFTLPTAPALFSTSVGGSETNGTGSPNDSISLTSWANSSNTLYATTGTSVSTGSPTIPSASASTSSFSASNQTTIASGQLTTPYSLTSKVTITLGAGDSLGFNTTAKLTSVPEPISLSLLGTGLLGLGLVRRRKANRAN